MAIAGEAPTIAKHLNKMEQKAFLTFVVVVMFMIASWYAVHNRINPEMTDRMLDEETPAE